MSAAVAPVTPPAAGRERLGGHEAFIDAWRRFSRASQRLKGRHRCGDGEVALTWPQALLLSALLHEPELPVGALADQADVSKPTATRMLDALEREGFVERRKTDRDRRTVLVSLTPDGRRVLDESWANLRTSLVRASAALGAQERRDATRLLDRLAVLMDEI